LDQTILAQFRIPFFLVSLLFGSWPALLHAELPEQESQAPASSSFLLVASQKMADPRFRKTVLVVTRHGNAGPIGVIVNRPEEIKLDMIFPEYPKAKELNLYFGGPVYPRQISYLVRGGDAVQGALAISSNTYLAYDMSTLVELLNGKRHYKDLRVMYGLASWAPGQLEYEIRLGGWYVIPFDEEVVFDHPPSGIWQELYNRANSIAL